MSDLQKKLQVKIKQWNKKDDFSNQKVKTSAKDKKQTRKAVSKAAKEARKATTKAVRKMRKTLHKKGLMGVDDDLKKVNALFFFIWNKASEEVFLDVFNSPHFWQKWCQYKHNLEHFWCSLTDNNRSKLLAAAITAYPNGNY